MKHLFLALGAILSVSVVKDWHLDQYVIASNSILALLLLEIGYLCAFFAVGAMLGQWAGERDSTGLRVYSPFLLQRIKCVFGKHYWTNWRFLDDTPPGIYCGLCHIKKV